MYGWIAFSVLSPNPSGQAAGKDQPNEIIITSLGHCESRAHSQPCHMAWWLRQSCGVPPDLTLETRPDVTEQQGTKEHVSLQSSKCCVCPGHETLLGREHRTALITQEGRLLTLQKGWRGMYVWRGDSHEGDLRIWLVIEATVSK